MTHLRRMTVEELRAMSSGSIDYNIPEYRVPLESATRICYWNASGRTPKSCFRKCCRSQNCLPCRWEAVYESGDCRHYPPWMPLRPEWLRLSRASAEQPRQIVIIIRGIHGIRPGQGCPTAQSVVSESETAATSAHLWLGIYSLALDAVKILWRIA